MKVANLEKGYQDKSNCGGRFGSGP